jgi:hypothetical protein
LQGCGGRTRHRSMAAQCQILAWQIRHGRCRRPHGWVRQQATQVRSHAFPPRHASIGTSVRPPTRSGLQTRHAARGVVPRAACGPCAVLAPFSRWPSTPLGLRRSSATCSRTWASAFARRSSGSRAAPNTQRGSRPTRRRPGHGTTLADVFRCVSLGPRPRPQVHVREVCCMSC